MTIDMSNFYLMTPMDQYEQLRKNIKTIPDKIIKEYELDQIENNGWVHVKIRKSAYGLPQAGILANDLLKERFKLAGYYPTSTTPSL